MKRKSVWKGLFWVEEIRLGRYRHFKGGEYEVLALAKHSETLEDYVVYRALYGEYGVWIRPASMWNETVERDGGVFRSEEGGRGRDERYRRFGIQRHAE